MRPRVWLLLATLATAFATALWWRPEASTVTRGLFLLCLAATWLSVIALAWPTRPLRLAAITLPPFLISAALLFPASSTAALRETYLDELRRYDGTAYVWGGENARGIDCSGLVRTGLVTASWKRGRATDAFRLWWFDASARALGEGYRGWTCAITRAENFAALDETLLRPGDLAVTQDGLHVLAYLGDRTWIQADPMPMRTHVDTLGAGPASGWFTVPIQVVRWRALDD